MKELGKIIHAVILIHTIFLPSMKREPSCVFSKTFLQQTFIYIKGIVKKKKKTSVDKNEFYVSD